MIGTVEIYVRGPYCGRIFSDTDFWEKKSESNQ